MSTWLRSFLYCLFIGIPCLAQAYDVFQKDAEDYVASLKAARKPALVAVCKTQNEKTIIILTLDRKPGRLYDFSHGEVGNESNILADKKGHLTFDEANGGVYTYTVLGNRVEDMEKLPFRFVPPEKAGEILGMTSMAFCKDRPPVYK